jgi:hypothetical protein
MAPLLQLQSFSEVLSRKKEKAAWFKLLGARVTLFAVRAGAALAANTS